MRFGATRVQEFLTRRWTVSRRQAGKHTFLTARPRYRIAWARHQKPKDDGVRPGSPSSKVLTPTHRFRLGNIRACKGTNRQEIQCTYSTGAICGYPPRVARHRDTRGLASRGWKPSCSQEEQERKPRPTSRTNRRKPTVHSHLMDVRRARLPSRSSSNFGCHFAGSALPIHAFERTLTRTPERMAVDD